MKRLWIVLAIVVTFGFTVLGWVGSRIYQEMPPIPERIVTSDGQIALFYMQGLNTTAVHGLWHAGPGSYPNVSARTAGRSRVEGRFA